MPKTHLFRLVETFLPTKKKSKKTIKHTFRLLPTANTGGKHAVSPRLVKPQTDFPIHLPESRWTRFAYSGATSLPAVYNGFSHGQICHFDSRRLFPNRPPILLFNSENKVISLRIAEAESHTLAPNTHPPAATLSHTSDCMPKNKAAATQRNCAAVNGRAALSGLKP